MVCYKLSCRGHLSWELDTEDYVPNAWDCDPCEQCFMGDDTDDWVEEFLELYD